MAVAAKRLARTRRQARVRRRVRGTDARPRLCVFRSNRHIYAQVISDQTGRTLVAASTVTPAMKAELTGTGNCDAARKVGARLAHLCQERAIRAVAFDRNGFLYHGRVKALADAAREAGLEF
ncbi:MAG: 50S ribosomal protein L18 [Candidatus Binatia bacterium]